MKNGILLFGLWIFLLINSPNQILAGIAHDSSITHMILTKKTRTLKIYHGETLFRTFFVALGKYPIGPKHLEGDKKTPEGEYFIDAKNPRSEYHKALRLSYPNKRDQIYAQQHHFDPGSNVEIHGLPDVYAYLGPLHRQHDWTWGCIALTNSEIEFLFPKVKLGTRVTILP